MTAARRKSTAAILPWHHLEPELQILMQEFDRLVEVMARLRSDCPWDREQTLESLRKYLLEESYECLDALNQYLAEPGEKTYQDLKEELGDVLLQVLFQSHLLKELTGRPALQELQQELENKLVRRHPHVFSDLKAQNADAVHKQWNKIKEQEKGKKSSALSEIPKSFPAVLRAHKIGEKCARIGFDWASPQEVWDQVISELHELEAAQNQAEREEELGDLLFSLCQWARHQKIDTEASLHGCIQKFLRRFEWMEQTALKDGQVFDQLSRTQMEELWVRAKASLKASGSAS